MIFIILLQLNIFANIIEANDSCIHDVKSFIGVNDIIRDYLEDFDFPVNIQYDVYPFLNRSGAEYKRQLNSCGLCEKGCSLHATCMAFEQSASDGCKLWLNDIKPQGILSGIDQTEQLAVQEFRSFIIGISIPLYIRFIKNHVANLLE